jgi:cyclic lactone autoinducer peptide
MMSNTNFDEPSRPSCVAPMWGRTLRKRGKPCHNLSVALAAVGASFVKTTSFVVGYQPEQRKIITDAKSRFTKAATHRRAP